MIRKFLNLAAKSGFGESLLLAIAKAAGNARATNRAKPEAGIAREIDAVYLWVDDQDEKWRAKRAQFRPTSETTVATAAARFRQFDELLYSIALLAKNAPFISTVFIVVDDQKPELSRIADQLPFEVRVVNHSEFMPEEFLPTFNSRSITANLHRIEGLSERFLYCNDDVFVAAPSKLTDWFKGDQLQLRFTNTKFPELSTLAANEVLYRARWKAVDLARKQGWQVSDRMPEHAPYPLTKSILAELWKLFPAEMELVGRSKFRTSEAILPELLGYYLAMGTNRAGFVETSSYKYVPMNDVRGIAPILDLALKPNSFLTVSLNDVSEVDARYLLGGAKLSKRYSRTLRMLAERVESKIVEKPKES